jgi:hypothetical protein
MFKAAHAIVWDEAPMSHKYVVTVLDKFLQNIMGNDIPFGGKIVIFAGDFRQVLPVVPKGGRGQIIAAIIKKLSFWNRIQNLHLTINMRVRCHQGGSNVAAQRFSDFLLQIGEGRQRHLPNLPPDTIEIPPEYVFTGIVYFVITHILPFTTFALFLHSYREQYCRLCKPHIPYPESKCT